MLAAPAKSDLHILKRSYDRCIYMIFIVVIVLKNLRKTGIYHAPCVPRVCCLVQCLQNVLRNVRNEISLFMLGGTNVTVKCCEYLLLMGCFVRHVWGSKCCTISATPTLSACKMNIYMHWVS